MAGMNGNVDKVFRWALGLIISIVIGAVTFLGHGVVANQELAVETHTDIRQEHKEDISSAIEKISEVNEQVVDFRAEQRAVNRFVVDALK